MGLFGSDTDRVVRVLRLEYGDGSSVRGKLTIVLGSRKPSRVAEDFADRCAALASSLLSEAPNASAAVGREAELVEKIQAQLRAEKAPGCRVELGPLQARGMFTSSAVREHPLKGRSDQPVVVVVDDDVMALTTVDALLSDQCRVLTATHAAEAERVLARLQPDVIITDYQMPGISGLELLRRVQIRWPDAPGILITGHGEYPDVIAARSDRRVFRVLLKPYQPESLIDAVRSAVALSRMRRSTNKLGGGRTR